MLIAEVEKTIQIKSAVSNVYTFFYEDFEGVGFYAARWYFKFTKELIEEYFFVSDEEEE